MSSGFFRGTNTEQVKHVNAEQKIIKEMQKNKRFPDHYAQKVDISKVSMDVMKPWIAKRITEMLGFEDDIVVDFCVAQLSEPGDKGLDPKMLQVVVTQAHEQTRAEIRTEKRKAEGRLSGQFEELANLVVPPHHLATRRRESSSSHPTDATRFRSRTSERHLTAVLRTYRCCY
ncbi:Srrm1 [Symbiodinium microadriaticum]|nr:Srrm1 [Symbiodinium microadriaticum]